MPETKSQSPAFIDATLRAFLENTQDMVFVKDRRLVYCGASPAFARMLGLDDPADVIGKTDFDIFQDPVLAQKYVEDDHRLFTRDEPMLHYIEPLPEKNGELRYGSTSKYLIRDRDGTPVGMYGISRDVTTEYLMRESYEREMQYLLSMPDDALAVAMIDVTAWRVFRSRTRSGLEALFPADAPLADLLCRAAEAAVDDGETAAYFRGLTQRQLLSDYQDGKRELRREYRRRLPSGEERWVRCELKFLVDPADGHICAAFFLRDVDEEKNLHSKLLRAAEQDAMTGLLNHEATLRHISQYLLGEGASGVHALFMVDLDNFKAINDTFGHQAGDEVITDIAAALRRCFRSSDIVGRVGGDEFLALMKHVGKSGVVRRKARELTEALQYIRACGGTTVELTGSVGISLYHGDGKTLDALYAEADAALYRAKSAGRNRAVFAEGGADGAENLPPDLAAAGNAVHLQTLLENIDGTVVLLEQEGSGFHVVYSSKNAPGAASAAVPGDTFSAFLAYAAIDEDRAALLRALRITADDGTALDHTCRSHGEGGVRFRHLRGSRLPDTPEGARRILLVLTDVTGQKLAELALERQKQREAAQYRRTLELREQMDVGVLVSARLDLTRNVCSDMRVFLPSLPKEPRWQTPLTVDAFIELLCRRHVEAVQREAFSARFGRAALGESFHSGTAALSFEHCLFDRPEHAVWVRTDAVMAQNPETHSIEAFLCIHSIDGERTAKAIIERLIEEEFESVLLIDVYSGRMTVQHIRPGEACPPETGQLYAAHIAEALPQFIADDVEAALAAFDLSVVRANLDENGGYAVSFCIRARGSGSVRQKWQFCYLDDMKRTILCRSRDVTELYAAEMDSLTGLYCREAFYRHVRAELSQHPGEPFWIVRADIDRFKVYNDLFGSRAGDRLLADIGKTLRENIVGGRVFGRIESDHFVALLSAGQADIRGFAAFSAGWLSCYRSDFRLSSSIGVFKITDPSLDVSLMCDRALLALRTVKNSYTEKIAFYDEAFRSRLLEEQALVGQVDAALSEEQFILFFQPQINYEDGSLIGAEALVRWQHPTRGLLTPDKFIPLFERNGFISRLDEYVWNKSCAYMREWIDAGGKLLPVSVAVNISRLDIYDRTMCDKLLALVQRYGLPPSALRLEITESAYMENPAQLVSVVETLHGMGFTVEMDDFGSGYSSLNTLKDVPVDILKLDVRFLADGPDNARGGNILSSVLRMARWLKLPVIAEGVETAAQAAYLNSLSCVYMQGYHFGRPMPAAEFVSLLIKRDVTPTDHYARVNIDGMAAFWDASTDTALLFDNFVGGAAIVEASCGNVEVVRANDDFFRELGVARSVFGDRMLHLPDCLSSGTRAPFAAMLSEAARSGGEAVAEVCALPLPGRPARFWLRCRAQFLAENNGSRLFYLLIENVTVRRKLEKSLSACRRRLRAGGPPADPAPPTGKK